jgi:putative ABC transport system permease protein
MSLPENIQPPKWPLRLMRRVLRTEYLEEIEGDMEEVFQDNLHQYSVRKAKRMYSWEMLKLLRPSLLRNLKSSYTLTPFAMYKNYFLIAWRNLAKKKAYSAINILGLGVGIACCFLIFTFVQTELSYDTYHTKRDRIYRVTHGSRISEDPKNLSKAAPSWVWGNAPIGPALKRDFPEIEKVVQFSGRADILLTHDDKKYQENGVFFMDSTVFDVFSWSLLQGDPKTALVNPYSIVLTQSTARKYFGSENALGKTLRGTDAPGRAYAGEYLVTGIMADLPDNSHFKFNALLSLSTFKKSLPEIFDNWDYADFYTYFLVNEKFDEAAFKQKLPGFAQRQLKDPKTRYLIELESLNDVYLKSDADRQPGETGSLSNVYVFSIIALFILVIAMINFMNLSTARSMERSKEVGIRKSIGAARGSLISQFLGESFVIVCLSMITAVCLVVISLPFMTGFTGKEFNIGLLVNWKSIPIILGGMVLIAFVAGSYPALVLSGFDPVHILKGINKSAAGVNLRRGLVVFQFSLSILLIAVTIIVYTQMNHLLDKDLGFDKESMLVIDYNYDEAVNAKSQLLKTTLESNPSILSAAFSRSVPGSHFPNAGTEIETKDGEMKMMTQPIFEVGIDFIPHFGLELVAGRSYSREFASDSSRALVINEAAAKQYGYKNAREIIGKKFSQWGRTGVVIGVVKDFNFTSLHQKIEPLTLPFQAYSSRYLSIKFKSQNVTKTVEQVRAVWSEIAPQRPFLFSFLNEDFNRQYQADFTFRKLFTTFSCLAIGIACLGLLGLATYMAEQRTKEIGIRKVLGADFRTIVMLLSSDFIKLVVIAILIATPVAWYVMNQWLEGFAYRVEISFWVFILAGLIAFLIVALTISYQSVKSALMNPISSLKSE